LAKRPFTTQAPFTRVRTNFCTDTNLHGSTLCLHRTGGTGRRSVQVWDQTCTLSPSNIRPVLPVPCKRRVEPCKFLSVQKFVRTRVNVASGDSSVYLGPMARILIRVRVAPGTRKCQARCGMFSKGVRVGSVLIFLVCAKKAIWAEAMTSSSWKWKIW